MQVLSALGRQKSSNTAANAFHPLAVVPSSGESTTSFTDKKQTSSSNSALKKFCLTAIGAAAVWKLKASL